MFSTRLIRCALASALVLICVGIVTADEKPPPRTMRVQVFGPDGKPLKGAKIHPTTWPQDPGNRVYVCDSDGKVTVAIAKEVQRLTLRASMVGHVALFTIWETEEAPPSIPEEYIFRLEKGTLIGGIVKNDDGEPIEGAKVAVMLERADEAYEGPIPTATFSAEDATRTTDAKGRWQLGTVPAGEDVKVKLLLSHPKYVSEERWGTLQNEQNVTMKALRDQSAVLVMQNGVPLSGTVIDGEGKKVAGAVVVWGDRPYVTWGSQEVLTDVEGRFQLPPLPVGPMNVTVVAPGWSPQQRKVEIGRPDNGSIQFDLQPGKKLRIRFVDDEGKAVPDMSVLITKWRGNEGLFNIKHSNVMDTKIPRQADKDGVYEWNWAPADEVEFSFYKEGYMQQHMKKIVPADGIEHVIKMIK